ncbi:MAG: hypothetical protein HOP02_12225 [Methylococcaceae bacterium]|nr:hypothetical protein [Methylococcaceae bacterium]
MVSIVVILLLALFCATSNADQIQKKTSATPLSNDLTLDDGLSNSLSFDGQEPVMEKTASFLDKFTFKLSQQIYAQINPHTTASGVEKQPTIEDNRLNVLLKYQNSFLPTWNVQGSAQTKIYWPTDYDYEQGRSSQAIELEQRVESIESRLNELFISKSFTNHTLKLGRQTLVWGEAEGNSVLDNINTLEYRDFSIIEMEDARLNQWFIAWDYFNEDLRASTFVNLNPQFNPLPRIGSPAYVPIPFNITDPDKDKYKLEVGSRLQWSVAHSDIALMAAYLYENPLHYATPTSMTGDIIAKENGYWLLGASANRAMGKLLLKLDLAYSQGLLADTLTAPQTAFPFQGSSSIRKNQIAATFGFDYALSNEQSITASVQARAFLDRTAGLEGGESTVSGDIFGTWLIRYSHSFNNGNLLFTSDNRGSLNADQALTSAMLSYTLSDHWSIMGSVIGTFATKDSSAALLDNDVRVGLTISYSH